MAQAEPSKTSGASPGQPPAPASDTPKRAPEAQQVLQALPSKTSLEELGLNPDDLPIFDPETGRLQMDGKKIEGGSFYLYSQSGDPLFGYLLDKDGIAISDIRAGRGVPKAKVDAASQPTAKVSEGVPEADFVKSAQAADADAAVPKGDSVRMAEPVEEVEEAEEAVAAEKDKAKRGKETEEESSDLNETVKATVPDLQREKAPPIRTEAERRARASQAAREKAERAAAKPSRPRTRTSAKTAQDSGLKPILTLSTLVCIVLVVMFSLNIFSLKDRFYGKKSGTNAENGQGEMTFEPEAFSASDYDTSESLDACAARFASSPWQISKPPENPNWGIRQTGIIDNGELDRSGLIQRQRSGKKAFQVSLEAGFLLSEGRKMDSISNLTIMLHAPSVGIKASFGFGKELGQAFVVVEKAGPKEPPRRFDLPIEYNRWYQLRVESNSDFTHFYFNGKKLDSIELDGHRVASIALTTFRSRALFRNVNLVEEGVKRDAASAQAASSPSESGGSSASKKP